MGFYYSDDELAHHGIKGQRWGVRRFQNRDGTRTAAGKARAKETTGQTEKKGLTDQQKRAIKIGAAVVGASLVAAGGVYLYKTGKIGNKGQEYISKHDWGNYDAGEFIKAGGTNKANLSEHVLQMAVNKNPYHRTDNCKEVAHAFCESMYSNDPKVIAGKKPRYEGNLFDYVTGKLGWKDSSVLSISANSHDQLKSNAIKQITKRFSDGDYGMIGFDGDHKRIQKLRDFGLLGPDEKGIDGHCFNWIIEDGQVKFFDCAPDREPVDASDYFKKAELGVETLITCYNRSKDANTK